MNYNTLSISENQNIIYEYEEMPNDLVEYIKLNKSLQKYFTQYCGIVNYKNKDFYILPKIANPTIS